MSEVPLYAFISCADLNAAWRLPELKPEYRGTSLIRNSPPLGPYSAVC